MPGPKPKYQPQFKTEGIAEAGRIARQRTAPSFLVHRAKIVLSEHPDISHERLAQAVGMHLRTVMKWRKRWAVQGFSRWISLVAEDLLFFPQKAWLKLRRTPANYQQCGSSRFPASASRRCFGKSVRSQPCRFPRARYGVSSTSMRYVPGFTDPVSVKDPRFLERAGPVVDLYQGDYEGVPLGLKEYALSANEKSQLQILEREFQTSPPGLGRPVHCESHYKRHGTVAYLAALDIQSGRVFGRVDQTTGVEPFSGAGRPRDEAGALCFSQTRVLDPGQWGFPSPVDLPCTTAEGLPEPDRYPSSDPRKLAHPNRDLFLHPSKKGSHAERPRRKNANGKPHPRISTPLQPNFQTLQLAIHQKRPRTQATQTQNRRLT